MEQVHHDNSSDFNALGGNTVLRVLQHDGLTVDEETVSHTQMVLYSTQSLLFRNTSVIDIPQHLHG